MKMDSLKMDNISKVQEGAEKLEGLNSKIENAQSDEERIMAFKEAIDMEEKLDLLENDLGLDSEDAKNLLYQIYKGEIDTGDALEELSKEFAGDKDGMMNKIKSSISSLEIGKKMRWAALFLLLSMGAATMANAKDFSGPKDLETLNPSLKNTKAFSIMMELNSAPLSMENKMLWQRIVTKAGLPDMDDNLNDYINKAVSKMPETKLGISNFVAELKSLKLL